MESYKYYLQFCYDSDISHGQGTSYIHINRKALFIKEKHEDLQREKKKKKALKIFQCHWKTI